MRVISTAVFGLILAIGLGSSVVGMAWGGNVSSCTDVQCSGGTSCNPQNGQCELPASSPSVTGHLVQPAGFADAQKLRRKIDTIYGGEWGSNDISVVDLQFAPGSFQVGHPIVVDRFGTGEITSIVTESRVSGKSSASDLFLLQGGELVGTAKISNVCPCPNSFGYWLEHKYCPVVRAS